MKIEECQIGLIYLIDSLFLWTDLIRSEEEDSEVYYDALFYCLSGGCLNLNYQDQN